MKFFEDDHSIIDFIGIQEAFNYYCSTQYSIKSNEIYN